MKKFEQLHLEDQLRIALFMLQTIFGAKQGMIEQYAAATGQTVHEVWQMVCAEVGLDECEPWIGYPAGPRKDSWSKAGADRELTPEYDRLYQQMRSWTGKDRH
jgi:hypothetical protein